MRKRTTKATKRRQGKVVDANVVDAPMNEAGKALAIVTTVEPMALDMLPPEDGAIIATSLRHEDEAALESGIASVFDSLRSARATDDRAAKDNTEDGNEDEEIGVEPTFVLLAELNRIWAQPLAA